MVEVRADFLSHIQGQLHAQTEEMSTKEQVGENASRRNSLQFPAMATAKPLPKPTTDLKTVLDSEVKEWHFHIYFHQGNAEEHHYALELRDAVLRLRRDGAFIAVPLFRVNTDPIGPHPAGKFSSLSRDKAIIRMCADRINRGPLSILVHPLTREARADHEVRNSWIGPSWPLDTSTLPVRTFEIPLQYPSLKLGYSSKVPFISPEDRAALGANVEKVLLKEKDAARAPVP
ncbi:hypothetical protein HMN09_01128800 [Mycena chlorophos]|uniref:DOPA 4,5-dioxygenase n=1 Tax=Mycena chlorophos TaxID=658473 RepID=A0A8H6W1F5_MYCCL|nr:hypothetical protein HMN09_01128800 [Mycena chlorophos]